MLTHVIHMSTLHSTYQYYIRQRVKLDHFDYFKGKIAPSVSLLGCSVIHDYYLKGKIRSLLTKYNKGQYMNTIVESHKRLESSQFLCEHRMLPYFTNR